MIKLNVKKILVCGIILLFVGASIIPLTVGINDEIQESMTYTTRGNILYVGGLGPSNYTTIQAAIDAAIDGNVVLGADGTYL